MASTCTTPSKGILFHNNEERVERLLTLEMRAEHVEPTRASILKWMLKKGYVTTEPANMSMLRAMCLPALKAVLTRKGIHVFDPRSNEERLIPHLRYSSKALQATGLMDCGNSHRQDAIVHINPSAIGKAWLSYRGMVELELQTHDVELETLTLREWLEITDRDRLSRFLTGHKRLSLKANGAIERYDSNEQAQRIKAEHEKNAAALGRAQSAKPSKRAAARMEKRQRRNVSSTWTKPVQAKQVRHRRWAVIVAKARTNPSGCAGRVRKATSNEGARHGPVRCFHRHQSPARRLRDRNRPR
jgi:hypothetical protein